MDDIDIRLLTLERIVNRLRRQILSTNLRFLANSTLLNNAGPMAGSPPSDNTEGCAGDRGLVPSGDLGIQAGGYLDFQLIDNSSCVIRVYNTMGTNVPPHALIWVSLAPELGINAYVFTSILQYYG